MDVKKTVIRGIHDLRIAFPGRGRCKQRETEKEHYGRSDDITVVPAEGDDTVVLVTLQWFSRVPAVIIWCIMSNSSVIDGDLYSSMSESEEEDIENSFFEGGESSSSVHDAQYFDDIIGEHVYKPDVPVQLIPFKGLIFISLKLAIKMYSEYAEIGGFDVRLST
ncbi:unnamed protein product [Lactuca saligna]|uniref:Uncharacterized protein n=1 Tax=Lactuca saligna TaxID=75948 RepID=A0AA35ZKS3_LACSI|nr:unnamed protein product [Lactuca saligna]